MSTSESQMNHMDNDCEGGVLLHRPAESCIKRWLLLFRKDAFYKDCQEPDSPPRRRQYLLLAIIILFGLTGMVLLLLWNYQCIFIERLCQGHEESSVFPVFAGWVSTPTPGSLG